jgi:predicted amidophosphoribosyltransferase
MAVTYHCAECGRRAQVNLTEDGPSLCAVCAGMDDMVCPGCANPISESERLTGRCGKDGEPIDQERATVVIDVDALVESGHMQDFGLGYPEWT